MRVCECGKQGGERKKKMTKMLFMFYYWLPFTLEGFGEPKAAASIQPFRQNQKRWRII